MSLVLNIYDFLVQSAAKLRCLRTIQPGADSRTFHDERRRDGLQSDHLQVDMEEEARDNDAMAIDALAPNKDMIHTNGLARQYIPKGPENHLVT